MKLDNKKGITKVYIIIVIAHSTSLYFQPFSAQTHSTQSSAQPASFLLSYHHQQDEKVLN